MRLRVEVGSLWAGFMWRSHNAERGGVGPDCLSFFCHSNTERLARSKTESTKIVSLLLETNVPLTHAL